MQVSISLFTVLVMLSMVSARTFDVKEEESNIRRFCGRDENGTVIQQPMTDSCEDPSREYVSYPVGEGWGGGSVFGGENPRYGGVFLFYSAFKIYYNPIGYNCDGVLLFDSMYKILRPKLAPNPDGVINPNDYYNFLSSSAARHTEQFSIHGIGKYRNGPPSVGMKCLVDPLSGYTDSKSTYAARHGKIYGCTICNELTPFDCPAEFERWYIASELMYRDGNICDKKFGERNDTGMWFSSIDYYLNPGFAAFLAYNGDIAQLGRDHPFMPGHYCHNQTGACECSLPEESPVYPDSLFGGTNPTLSLPVTLHGYPYHSRKLGQSLSGDCSAPIIQAVFKLSADESWDDRNKTVIEYGRLNKTEMMDLNELRERVFTPGIYINTTAPERPLIPKMSGLMHASLLLYRDANVTLVRCLIEPSDNFQTAEAQRYTQGTPYNCITCVNASPCAAPQVKNMTTDWILDTVIGFDPIAFVPGITIPPGYDLILAAYNATSRGDALSLIDGATSAADLEVDDTFWAPFTYSNDIT